MPARSAIRHIAAMSSQLAAHRSGARLMVRPPSQVALNTPSLNLFGPRIGLVVRVSVMACSFHLSDRGRDATRRARTQGRFSAREAMCRSVRGADGDIRTYSAFKVGWLLNRKIHRFRPLQDLIYIGCPPKGVGKIHPISNKASELHEPPANGHRREPVLSGEINYELSSSKEPPAGKRDKCAKEVQTVRHRGSLFQEYSTWGPARARETWSHP